MQWKGRPVQLKRASCQSDRDLTAFYREWAEFSSDASSRKVGEQMLMLLAKMEALAAEVAVWGLTSHGRLVLLAADDYRTPWYLTIIAVPWGGFSIHYLMPDLEAPWPNAQVEGEANDLENAYRMIRIAMCRSGGWPDLQMSA